MDVRTLISANLFLLLGYGAALWLLAWTQPDLRGARWMTRAYAVGAVGTALTALRGHISDALSIVAGGMLVLLMTAFVHFAMQDFAGKSRILRRLDGINLTLALAMFLWFTYVHNSVEARIIGISLAIMVEMSLSLRTLLAPALKYQDASIWAMIGLMAFEVVANFARIITTAIFGTPRQFMSSDLIQAATILGYMVAAAGLAFGFIWMTTARLRHELERQARTDALTGLLNRRALLDEAPRHLQRSHQNRLPLSLIVIDLDHFKQINDTWGHEAGDRALGAVSEIFRKELRRTDLLARYGGEEFLIVLPETPREDALSLAQRLRAAVEALVIRTPDGCISVTASFGVTSLNQDFREESWSTLLRRGDRALYRAKKAGRNCAVLA